MGSYYDMIPNFRYWDVEAWKNYIREYVVPIYRTTATLLEIRNELLPYVGKSLKTVKDNDERLLPFLVGGIDENGNYKERSLARLIKLMFGIYVEPREFASAVGEAGENGLSAVMVKSEDEKKISFLIMIRKLNEFSRAVLQKAGIEAQPYLKVDEILQDPNKLLDALKELYKACVSFSANHNYYTFFIVSTASIHWKYLATAYPKLREHFEEIKEFLELEPIFVPNIDSEELKKKYTIWGRKEEGIASNVHQIQLEIWEAFPAKDIFGYIVDDPENLKDEYRKLVNDTLGYDWEQKDKLNVGNIEFDPRKEYLLKINGFYIEKWPEIYVVIEYLQEHFLFFHGFRRYDYDHFIKAFTQPYEREMSKPKILLTEFLDEIGPALFLGIARIQTVKEGVQDIEKRESQHYNKRYLLDYLKEHSNDYHLIYVGKAFEGAYWWL